MESKNELDQSDRIHKTEAKREKGCSRRHRPLKILLVTRWRYPHIGGGSNYLTGLRSGLEALGHSVDIAAPNQFGMDRVREIRAGLTKRIEMSYQDRYVECSSEMVKADVELYSNESLFSTLDLSKYDLIHSHDSISANVIGRLNQAHLKPHVLTLHETSKLKKIRPGASADAEKFYFTRLEQQAIDYAHRIILICDAYRSQLTPFRIDDRKLVTVHTGIEFPEVPPAPRRNRRLVVTCVARLGRMKGHQYLLKAVSMLGRDRRKVKVWIVGSGHKLDSLKEQSEALGLDRVTFLGSRNDVPELLSRTDIFVLPSLRDNFPLSILEGMFSGQAIISTRTGGIPEMISHGETGLLVDPGNSKQLADTLRIFIRDAELRRKIGCNARAHAQEHFTRERMARQVEEVYIGLL